MALVPADLPDDMDALKAMISAMAEKSAIDNAELAELKARNARADERITQLTSIIKMLERARYGSRSEKLKIDRLNEEQRAFIFGQVCALLDILVWAAAFEDLRSRPTWVSYSWSISFLTAES